MRALRLCILRERPMCEEPGCNKPAEHVDHIRAKEAGGTDD